MIFKILSKNRNTLRSRIFLLNLISFAILTEIVIQTDNFLAKTLMLINCLFFLTPIFLIGDKTIGEFELNDKYISFITQFGDKIELKLIDIISCQIKYAGCKGDLHIMAGGLIWNTGVNKFKIETNEKKYEILFLSQSINDKDKIFQYINILKNNNISYHFEMNGRTFESSVNLDI